MQNLVTNDYINEKFGDSKVKRDKDNEYSKTGFEYKSKVAS